MAIITITKRRRQFLHYPKGIVVSLPSFMKKIIVALDYINLKKSLSYVKKVSSLIWGVKLRGLVLKHSLKIVEEFKQYTNVMLDFKLYDIESAMDESIRMQMEVGVDLTTVHCRSMFIPDISYQKNIIGVTVLTSVNKFDIPYKMILFANNNYGGIVCSSQDLSKINIPNDNLLKLCPGIRPTFYSNIDDQNRISTPKYAIDNGADLLIIGRSIIFSN